MKFFQSVLKKWSNVQQNWKKNFHHRRGGGRGGQARHGNFHHVFTFFNLKPSLRLWMAMHPMVAFYLYYWLNCVQVLSKIFAFMLSTSSPGQSLYRCLEIYQRSCYFSWVSVRAEL